MTLAPPANDVPEALRWSPADSTGSGNSAEKIVRTVLARRRTFGITRLGSITRLDRIGIPVAQVVRPLALSNAVAQGKGLTLIEAAASALMEAVETWAAERIPEDKLQVASAAEIGPAAASLFSGMVSAEADAHWSTRPLAWVDGWDLFSSTIIPVPAALVDTQYTWPSPHPRVFARTTTGLGAGASLRAAFIQAACEVLERQAVSAADRDVCFFDRWQMDLSKVGRASAGLLHKLREAHLLVGAWRVPAPHRLPVYWVHVMEKDEGSELAPLPAEGFACAFDHDLALAKALLEACQARLAAIAGAREDMTRRTYLEEYDRAQLAEWRVQLAEPPRPLRWDGSALPSPSDPVDTLIDALAKAGARAAIVVPLFSDEAAGIHVLRLVAPPLDPGRRH